MNKNTLIQHDLIELGQTYGTWALMKHRAALFGQYVINTTDLIEFDSSYRDAIHKERDHSKAFDMIVEYLFNERYNELE